MAKIEDSAQGRDFLAQEPELATAVFYADLGPGADTAQVWQLLAAQAKDPYMDTLRQDVLQTYPSLAQLEADLGQLYGRVQSAYPGFTPPAKTYTLASGFRIDLLYLDSLLLIGLEHFMPDNAHYEPPSIPRYIRQRMRPYAIVPGVAKLLADKYVKTDFNPEQAMVEEMVRWGKILYFQEQMLPCTPDTVLIGYPAAALADVEKNAPMIYAHFVDRGLFFSTDHLLRAKYVGERPTITEIGPACPGRIGQWMGWQIVRKWAKDKALSLPQVMAEPDGRKIFNEARWKPE